MHVKSESSHPFWEYMHSSQQFRGHLLSSPDVWKSRVAFSAPIKPAVSRNEPFDSILLKASKKKYEKKKLTLT